MIKISILLVLVFLTFEAQKDYTSTVLDFANGIKTQQFKGKAFQKLAYITDTYGPRLWGSRQLEMVIEEVRKMAQKQGFDNVRNQPVVNFTKWERGHQSLTLYSPRPKPTPLGVIGLGGSVNGSVQADVIVLKDFQQLQQKKSLISGKIVCFNNKWVDYSHSVQYRVDGPSKVAKYGAKAMLVRSVASESIYSVHTGYMEYVPELPKIPCAAITVEDAEMFQRMQNRNQTIHVKLVLQNRFVPGANSSNVIFQIIGSQWPDQVVLGGGHIDSWDTGSQTGANDDAGGFLTVFEALRLIKTLGYKPRRTLRFIAWSGEQSGSQRDGAAQYAERHKDQLKKHVAAFESDLGSTKLYGFGHTGTGQQIVKDILQKYLTLVGAGAYSQDGYSADVEPLNQQGVPIFKNLIEDTLDHKFYFKYHHTAGDSMSMMNASDLDSNVVGIASFLYILADLQHSVRNVTNIETVE